jgi:hypothetical protein
VITRKEGHSWLESYLGDNNVSKAFFQAKYSPRPEAKLLVKFVAMHINTHPGRLNKGRLAFQEKLNGVMAQGQLNE